MAKSSNFVPGVAIFLAGAAVAAVASSRRNRGPDTTVELKRELAQLATRLETHESATEERLSRVESVVETHTSRLADVPSTSQIVAAMEQLLAKTMTSLDDRLTNQAHAIELLKTTVSQTDGLLERVLESLDTLQSTVGGADSEEESLLGRPIA